MNLRISVALFLVALVGCANGPDRVGSPDAWYAPVNERDDPVLGVFEGRIPCTDPELIGCEKVKVALVLYHDRATNAPTTYRLARVYVATSPEGSRLVIDGTWHIERGTKLDPDAVVYALDSSAPDEFRSYWAIGSDILFVLDADRTPRVGTAGWSYVLNRTH